MHPRRPVLLLSICCGMLTAVAPRAMASLNTQLLHSGFEEIRENGGRAYYWRGAGVHALLTDGAAIKLAFADASSSKTIGLTFTGANPRCEPEGQVRTNSKIFDYRGANRSEWIEGSPIYERIRYRNVYAGIDLIFHSNAGALEYDFELAPNISPHAIELRFESAAVYVNDAGDIEAGSALVQKRPLVYQTRDGQRTEIPCHYEISPSGGVRLRLGAYDPHWPLTIDPVLNYSTFLGGQGFESINGMAADATGNIYIAGETDSFAFSSGLRRSSRDAFVAKLNPLGTALVYIAYLGGSGADSARGIAVDGAGSVYVTGTTSSTDFPVTFGALSTRNAGEQDAFAAKLNTSGALLFSTYIGGPGSEQAYGIAIDASGNTYIAGQTGSFSFPVTSGVFQTMNRGGSSDCFIAKLNAAGSALIYATYLGGSGLDLCHGIAVDSGGNAYVTGTSYSNDFPTQTAVQSALAGSADAFVAKLNQTASALVYSTFLGGMSVDEGNAITVDSSGAAYVAGDTASINFPVTMGAFQTALKGTYNAFAAKISAGGNFAYVTLFGGSGVDSATAISLDSSSNLIIAGFTSSGDLPLLEPVQGGLHGSFDAFASVLSNSGQWLRFSSYLGGAGDDRALAVASLPGNRIFVGGTTASLDFPTTQTTAQPLSGGGNDAFAAEITYLGPPQTQGLLFVPLGPCRVADTRGGFTGSFGPPYMTAGSSRTFLLPSSSCGIPASARAYSLNVTALPKAGPLYYLTIWQAGQPMPTTSTLNSFDGRVIANAAIVSAGTGGAISVFASNDADVIIDINGYFDQPSNPQGLAFYAIPPCRIVDTRTTAGPFGSPFIAGGGARMFPLSSSTACPVSAARAYSMNVTAIPHKSLQFLILWPAGESFPAVSTLNSFNGTVVANAALVPAGSGAGINVLVSDDADVIIDVNGYFASTGGPGSLSFNSVAPCRIADTRNSAFGIFGPPSLAANLTRTFAITQASCGVPASAQAYVLNFTSLPQAPLEFLSVWPAGQPYPGVSTLNAVTGTVVANAAIVPAGAGGVINVYASNPTNLAIDVNGYFAP